MAAAFSAVTGAFSVLAGVLGAFSCLPEADGDFDNCSFSTGATLGVTSLTSTGLVSRTGVGCEGALFTTGLVGSAFADAGLGGVGVRDSGTFVATGCAGFAGGLGCLGCVRRADGLPPDAGLAALGGARREPREQPAESPKGPALRRAGRSRGPAPLLAAEAESSSVAADGATLLCSTSPPTSEGLAGGNVRMETSKSSVMYFGWTFSTTASTSATASTISDPPLISRPA